VTQRILGSGACGDTEVHDLDRVPDQHDVGGLDVTVHHCGLVDGGQRRRHLRTDPHRGGR
jgi:hypothetical protein